MSVDKHELQKRLVKAALPLLDLPPSTTREGNTVYQNVKRQLERKVADDPMSFKDFWFYYEASRKEIEKALERPCVGWFRKKKKT